MRAVGGRARRTGLAWGLPPCSEWMRYDGLVGARRAPGEAIRSGGPVSAQSPSHQPGSSAVDQRGAGGFHAALDRMRPHRARHTRASPRNHMPVPWHEVLDEAEMRATDAGIADKSSIVCRMGLLLLAGGASTWRVRDAMNATAAVLGVTCSTDVSLTSIDCTCFDETGSFSEVASLPSTGVNTERIWDMERLVERVRTEGSTLSVAAFHDLMDEVERKPGNYAPWQVALAAATACAAFVFLLGGGPVEMGCAFAGAGLGCLVRRLMLDRHLTHLVCTGVGVAVACLAYVACSHVVALVQPGLVEHNAGYIGAMLFVVPGFPLITSGLDIAKMDLRAGIERAVYALSIIVVATLVAWLISSVASLTPDDFDALGLGPVPLMILRLLMSFIGVFGFSMLFNSPYPMAATAGAVGAVTNALRLTAVDAGVLTPEAAAFAASFAAGLLAAAAARATGYPRISITVPSIVIMVPGLYLYRAVYFMGALETLSALDWGFRAMLIILFLPMGLAAARFITDPAWRHCT